ncbi:hypothetical protein DW660_15335 [Coprobacillus sp. AM23-9LB]|nr:hypothetical protein DW660_15335 [Coprobacillus sp. AM23-9LB]
MFKAVTSIWCVKDRLDHVVHYVEDEEKTVDAVIDYVNNDNKTNEKKYVTCINCDSFDPCKSMMNTKKFFNDHKQIMAFHGYQSFEPGEVSSEVAHEIGVKLVEELYGNRFEVVVATHVDKNHIHNHFLLNSTSFVDGKRFCNTKKDYQMLRETSDKLCLEYGLSVIKNPKKYTKKVNQYILKSFMNEIKRDIDATVLECARYVEFNAVMHNKGYSFGEINDEPVIYHPYCEEPIYIKSLGNIKNPKKYTKKVNQYILKSFMNEIKRDIDATVLECARYMEFNAVMHNKGYSFGEINSEPVIYHPYCEEPIYIKSLGNQYHREQIKERLTTKVIPFQNMEQNKYYYQCKDYYRQYRQKKLPQLAGMYVARLVYLNILPQVKQKLSKETRRELKKLDQYTNDIELLAKNKIEDITQLDSYQENKQDELDYLIKQRQQCYYYRRKAKDEDEKEMWSAKAKEFTPQIKSLRFEIKSCKRIRERSIQKDIEKLAMKKIKQRESRDER